MKSSRVIAPILITIALLVILTAPALAQTSPLTELEKDCAITNIWCGTGSGTLTCNKATTGCNLCDALVVTRNITVLLMWFAMIGAVLMIVVGALTMMFAAGSEERFAKGKKAILNAVIGLAIALGAWLIVNTVLQFLSPGGVAVPWSQINCS